MISQALKGLIAPPTFTIASARIRSISAAAPDHDAAHRVAVAVDVLRERVHDEVGAQRERALQHRGGERGVDAAQRARLVRDPGDRLDVGDPGARVGRRLDVHEPRLRPDGRPDGVEVGGVDQRRGDAVLPGKQLGEQAVGADVGVVGAHHVVAGAQEGEEHRVQRGHPGGERDRRLAAVERGELLLQPALVRPAVAGVERGAGARPAQLGRVVGQGVGVGGHQRAADGPGAGVDGVAGVDGEGGEVWAVVRHGCLRTRAPGRPGGAGR